MSKDGILVVGHGSRLAYSSEVVSFMTERLAERFDPSPVLPGFMNIDRPSIDESMSDLVVRGAETIYVVPAFLAHGVHTTQDITRKVGLGEGEREGTVQVNGTRVDLKYCDPIGCDRRVADILEDRILARMQ
ncbi:MAG: sirohydrochlorin nickelochelatase [Methanomassiliicoccales archaeon]